MVPLLAARPIASTADFRGFGPRPSLLINHLHCEIRRTQGRIGQVGLGEAVLCERFREWHEIDNRAGGQVSGIFVQHRKPI